METVTHHKLLIVSCDLLRSHAIPLGPQTIQLRKLSVAPCDLACIQIPPNKEAMRSGDHPSNLKRFREDRHGLAPREVHAYFPVRAECRCEGQAGPEQCDSGDQDPAEQRHDEEAGRRGLLAFSSSAGRSALRCIRRRVAERSALSTDAGQMTVGLFFTTRPVEMHSLRAADAVYR